MYIRIGYSVLIACLIKIITHLHKIIKYNFMQLYKENNMKDRLAAALGSFGVVLWNVLTVLMVAAPFLVLGISPLWTLVAIAAIMFVPPFLGDIGLFALYIWGITKAAALTPSFLTTLFYISFGIFIISKVISVGLAIKCARD